MIICHRNPVTLSITILTVRETGPPMAGSKCNARLPFASALLATYRCKQGLLLSFDTLAHAGWTFQALPRRFSLYSIEMSHVKNRFLT